VIHWRERPDKGIVAPTPPDGQQWTAPDGLFSYEIFGQLYWTTQHSPKPANRPQVSMQPMSLP
jgi:hypothetical protein